MIDTPNIGKASAERQAREIRAAVLEGTDRWIDAQKRYVSDVVWAVAEREGRQQEIAYGEDPCWGELRSQVAAELEPLVDRLRQVRTPTEVRLPLLALVGKHLAMDIVNREAPPHSKLPGEGLRGAVMDAVRREDIRQRLSRPGVRGRLRQTGQAPGQLLGGRKPQPGSGFAVEADDLLRQHGVPGRHRLIARWLEASFEPAGAGVTAWLVKQRLAAGRRRRSPQ